MQIVSLKIKNFLSISDVELAPGKVNQIVGSNNMGKSSVIKALQFAAKGSSDPSLVRQGSDAAEVIIELDDETTIRRRLSAEGKQSVTVKRGDMTATAPQGILDVLFASGSFNPLEIISSKNRNEIIMNAIPLKITLKEVSEALGISAAELPPVDENQHALKLLDQLYSYYYNRRAEANRVASDKLKKYEFAEQDLPKEVVAPLKTKAEIEKEANDTNLAIGEYKAKQQVAIDAANTKLKIEEQARNAQEFVRQCEEDIRLITEKMNQKKTILEGLNTQIAELREKAIEAPDFGQQIRDCELKLSNLRVLYGEVTTFEQIEKRRQVVAEMKKESEEASANAALIDNHVQKLKNELPKTLMNSAKMPIEGLEYSEGQFTLDGIQIANLSTSKTIRLAVAVARTLASKSKIICIDGCEQLDEETYENFRHEIEGDGFVYFVTKVGEPFKAGQESGDKIVEMNAGGIQQ